MRRTSAILTINIMAVFLLSSLCFAEEDINELVSKGIQSYNQENFKTSYDYFRKAMKINPLHPEASQWYWKIKSERDVKYLTDKSPVAEGKKERAGEVIEKTPEKTPVKTPEKERGPEPKIGRPDPALNKELNNKIKVLDNRVVTLMKKIDEQNRDVEVQNAREMEDLQLQTSALSLRTTILYAVLGSVSVLLVAFMLVGISWSRKKYKKFPAVSIAAGEGIAHLPAVVSTPPGGRIISDNRINSIQLARKMLNSEADLMNKFRSSVSPRDMDPLSVLAGEYFEKDGDGHIISIDREHGGLITTTAEYYRRLETTVAGFVYLIEKKLNRLNNDTKVRELCNDVGMKLGLTSSEIIDLRLGALLKDIGFLLIPEKIYFKPGKLTENERTQIQKHVSYSLKIAKSIAMPGGVLESLISHHELYDSSGYPTGIGGDDIPLNSRIISICDGYVSLTSDRPHRKAIETGKALKIIEKESRRYDPEILDAFFEIVHDKKT